MPDFSLHSHQTAADKPHSLVVLLHGYGADGQDLLPLGQMWQAHFPQTLFVCPDAPHPHEGGLAGRQWFSLTRGLDGDAIAELLEEAAPVIDGYLDELLAHYQLTAKQLVLGGFSQGAMLALHVGLRRNECLAGIISFSGLMPHPPPPAKDYPPVLLTHGAQDPLIPHECLAQAKEHLEARHIKAASQLEPQLGHGINDALVARAQNFIASCLS